MVNQPLMSGNRAGQKTIKTIQIFQFFFFLNIEHWEGGNREGEGVVAETGS